MVIKMIKTCFCAVAMLIGAMIGSYAPAEWRGDASRLAADLQSVDMALADRLHQR
jgi:hypothetical protein